jgi:hypothetical protein
VGAVNIRKASAFHSSRGLRARNEKYETADRPDIIVVLDVAVINHTELVELSWLSSGHYRTDRCTNPPVWLSISNFFSQGTRWFEQSQGRDAIRTKELASTLYFSSSFRRCSRAFASCSGLDQ